VVNVDIVKLVRFVNAKMTKPRKDWAWKMYMYLGYQVVEDDEQLRAFNACIKAIRRQKSGKFKRQKK
jgi:hypothetical protein